MRKLVVLRGAPGSGKSTWVKKNGLEDYALSSDKIRYMLGSSEFLIESETYSPAPKINKKVWELLFNILQTRMQNGEFTIIDATNTRASEIRKYTELAKKYRYEVYCVDFSGIPDDVCKKQNQSRPISQVVPEEAVDRFLNRLKESKIPDGVKVISPETHLEDYFYQETVVSSEKYKKIMFLGDIHGCYNALMKALDGGIKEDIFYVFTGDYLDRGPQNVEVMNFLLENYEKENVIFLEGNHERHIYDWAKGFPIRARQFAEVTAKELSAGSVSTKDAMKFCSVLQEYANITYDDANNHHIFACHGGIGDFLFTDIRNCYLMGANMFIKGHGAYEQSNKMAEIFAKRHPDMVQVHGHRNIMKAPIKVSANCRNLEGGVEQGLYLRVFEINADGNEEYKYFKQEKKE